MSDKETQQPSESEPEPRREDGVLTPSEIVAKHRSARGGIVSRSGVTHKVREDLRAYHEARGWGEPDSEKVDELVREVLA